MKPTDFDSIRAGGNAIETPKIPEPVKDDHPSTKGAPIKTDRGTFKFRDHA